MDNIQKYNLSPAVIEAINQHAPDLKVGDTFIKDGSYGVEVYRVKGFTEVEHGNNTFTYVIYERATDWDITEWEEKRTSISDFKQYYLKQTKLPEGTTPKEWLEEAKKLIAGELDMSVYEDADSDSLNSNTALMNKSSKTALIAVQEQLEIKRKRVEMVHAFVAFEMAKKKAELEKIKKDLYGVMAVFQKKISKIMAVIATIELYLGINEDIFQLQDGEKASADDPICFRQMILFMDEEMGYWKNGEGLDFSNIDWFDEWLVKDGNFKKLIPESKGMVVFKPRRYDRRYDGHDPRTRAYYNMMNKVSYILIRNGECLYRIYTEHISVHKRVFPKRAELEELLNTLDGEIKEGSYYSRDAKKEQAENSIDNYKRIAILMQGLLDRSEVFNPIKKQISIFKQEESEGLIRYIYDDEAALPSGRLTFHEWKKSINENIQHGSRVVCTNYGRGDDNSDRFLKHYFNKYSIPKTPSLGIYEVEKYIREEFEWLDKEEFEKLVASGASYEVIDVNSKKYSFNNASGKANDGYKVKYGKELLTIMYQAGGEVWSWNGSSDRKNRIRFIIKRTDSEILNYDQIDLEDIEFYINSRVDRPNYLDMMPVLETLKQKRLEELESEKAFARLVFDRNINNGLSEEVLNQRVWECIEWWKFKNQWKRPIEKDDALALRMIEKRINSKNYLKLKP